jgi:hypothetical protein
VIFTVLLFCFSLLAFAYMCGTKEDRLKQYSMRFGLAALAASVIVYLACMTGFGR